MNDKPWKVVRLQALEEAKAEGVGEDGFLTEVPLDLGSKPCGLLWNCWRKWSNVPIGQSRQSRFF